MISNYTREPIIHRPFEREYSFHTSLSGGPGGQHVNKTETRVELRFDIKNSKLLSAREKKIIFNKLQHKINSEGILQVFTREYRSQQRNKELAIKKFYQLLQQALKKKKKRIPTKPSRKKIEERITTKKKQAEKKKMRNKPRITGNSNPTGE